MPACRRAARAGQMPVFKPHYLLGCQASQNGQATRATSQRSPTPGTRGRLAEEKIRYTGENGIRFHPMVVRSIAGPDYGGFAVTSKDTQSFDWTFDVNAVSAEAKKHLDEYEKAGHRGDPFTFSEKKDKIDPENLTVVAFVQDEKTKAVLQSTLVRLKRPLASTNNR